ncbi:MAG: hypothetical protein RL136_390 [Planctomycetota bacterium]
MRAADAANCNEPVTRMHPAMGGVVLAECRCPSCDAWSARRHDHHDGTTAVLLHVSSPASGRGFAASMQPTPQCAISMAALRPLAVGANSNASTRERAASACSDASGRFETVRWMRVGSYPARSEVTRARRSLRECALPSRGARPRSSSNRARRFPGSRSAWPTTQPSTTVCRARCSRRHAPSNSPPRISGHLRRGCSGACRGRSERVVPKRSAQEATVQHTDTAGDRVETVDRGAAEDGHLDCGKLQSLPRIQTRRGFTHESDEQWLPFVEVAEFDGAHEAAAPISTRCARFASEHDDGTNASSARQTKQRAPVQSDVGQ